MFRRRRRRQLPVEPLPDGLPKRGLFTEPIHVTALSTLDPERVDEGWRVTFMVEIRDDARQRCPDVAIEARVTSPLRSAVAVGNTDMLGRVRFRTTGPDGTYRIDLIDVAAGGLDWERSTSPADLTIDVG